MIVWRILNTLVAVGIAWFMSKLVNDVHKYAWPVCFCVIMYPFIDMSTAGWRATMLNYWWPLFTLLVLAYYLKKVMQGKTLRIYEYIISIIFAIFTCNHEQTATVLLILFLGVSAYVCSTWWISSIRPFYGSMQKNFCDSRQNDGNRDV